MSTTAPTEERLDSRDALAFLIVAVAWLAIATWHIDLPGLYMDAVNPDYLAVRVLNPHHAEIVEWVLPGNDLLGGRWPLLVALYHGSQTLWFGFPMFALFGTTLETLRITHALFGLAVLGALFFCLRRALLSPLPAAGTCAVLAIDPSFSYAFRTQSYITVFGLTWVLVATAILLRARATGSGWWRSGFFCGFAASAYFIHAFFIAAFAPAVLVFTRSRTQPWRARAQWLAGVALGLLPYIAGYVLLMRKVGGPAGFMRFYVEQSRELEAFASRLSWPDRAAHAASMLQAVVTDAWHHAMMFGPLHPVPGGLIKILLLLVAPVALWSVAEIARSASVPLRLVLALPVAFIVVSLLFGDRLAGHHFVVLVPLLYAVLALGLRDALFVPGRTRRPGRALVLAAAVAGLSLNLAGQAAEMKELERTGGVGRMSDAIDRLADDLNRMPRKPFMFFPEWGLALPVQFLTHGTVGIDTDPHYDRARALLCEGSDVGVGLIEDRDARRSTWARELGAVPTSMPYRQRDGAVAFEIITFRAQAPHAPCGG